MFLKQTKNEQHFWGGGEKEKGKERKELKKVKVVAKMKCLLDTRSAFSVCVFLFCFLKMNKYLCQMIC